MIYTCGKCYRECESETATFEAFGQAHTDVISSCCGADVYTETDREHPVQAIALPEADRWMEHAI